VRLVAAARNAWLAGDPRKATAMLHDARLRHAAPEAAHQRDLLVDEIELRSRAASVTLDALLESCDRLADAHRDLAVLALLRAGEAVCFSGEHVRYAEIAQRARQLRRRRETPRVELMLSHVDGFAAVFLGHFPDAIEPLRRVVRLGMSLRTVESLTAASSAALLLADIAGARTAAELAMQLARDDGDFCTSPLAHMMLTFAEFGLGRYSSAQQSATAGLEASRDARQDMYARDHLGLLAVLAAIHGEADECFLHLRELAVPPGTGRWSRPRALAQWALAAIDVQRGRSWAAVSRLTSLTSPDKQRGQTVIEILSTPWLVEAARTDDRPRAEAALALFDAWSSLSGNPVHHALSARCHALLAPRGSEADEWFERSLALHLSAEADFERARTELLYGQELRRTRRPKDARDHLHAALETFEQLGVASWANQARSELRGAGETVDASPAPAARALTAQQLQIARLVVDGATNREVAARLYLSTRTVDHHMRNIFTRLGIRSRVELAKLL
jgi:DNA-binding CsgD family transcriptional regulator